MCGIVGFVDFSRKIGDKTISDMVQTLNHRGPDDSGVYRKSGVSLAHTRLSIIDLSSLAHQPILFDGLAIVFNGEVYNFLEIRQELIGFGYEFVSNSDTEVVLKAYHKWGKECVVKFRGMWAFAVWDEKKDELVLCRDRVGVKPLYYGLQDDVFLFASELKAICAHDGFKRELNKDALGCFFKYGYIPAPHSIYKDIFKLEPGCFLTLSPNKKITKEQYWKAEDFYLDGLKNKDYWLGKSENDILDELEGILTESFALRLVSDIPVGVFLSGGVDSSLVAALLQKASSMPLKTFTIGFDEPKYNEAPFAKAVADYLGTEHIELYCTPNNAYEIISKLPTLYDEPFGDSSAIPTYLVSELAKQHVGVCLSADGADEMFGGYNNYAPTMKLYNLLDALPSCRIKLTPLLLSKQAEFLASLMHDALPSKRQVTNFIDKYIKFANAFSAKNPIDVFDISKSYWFSNELTKLLPWMKEIPFLYVNDSFGGDALNNIMLQDMQTYMTDDILVKVDRATMSVSLEGREPFLDPKIMEFALRMPSALKIKDGQNKYSLRQILYRHIPRHLVDRPKHGFGIPAHEWFKNELKDLYEYYLSEERLKESGLFDAKYVRSMLADYYAGKPVNIGKFWLLLSFEMWREKWL